MWGWSKPARFPHHNDQVGAVLFNDQDTADARPTRRLRARQVDGVGVTDGSLAGSRLDEALAFGWPACFPQLADPHFTAIASASMRNSGRASRATPMSVSAGLWCPNSSTLAVGDHVIPRF